MIMRWNSGNEIMGVYEYKDSEHSRRMGHCEFLPSDGDLCVCVSHSGDCFNNYIAIRKQPCGGYKSIGEFGAYVFGDKSFNLKSREFYLLQAGETVNLEGVCTQ